MSAIMTGDALEGPLGTFVRDARTHLTLVLDGSGRVVAQRGFTRRVDVMSACALAAAMHASASALSRQLQASPFGPLHHAGGDRQLFLAPLPSAHGERLLLAVFSGESSYGLVRLYWQDLCAALAPGASPTVSAERPSAEAFEADLQRSLAALFGEG